PNEELVTDFGILGSTASYQLKSGSQSLILPTFGRGAGGLWDLQLNRTLPLDLRISTGVGSSELNLQQLTLTGLSIDAGVGKVEVTLPATGNFEATVNGGVGGITLYIPATMAAQIEAKAGLGSVRVEGDYVQQDGLYRSLNYDGALNRVNLIVEGGIGAITVEQMQLQ
ncbi:MAG: hypothetical protein KDE19_09540, partial [Caldilineaceae bacterium]|nr:hypothetical protein [Caldilineaceae bacterium]